MPILIEIFIGLQDLDPGAVAEFSLPAIFIIIFFITFLTEDGACLLAGALASANIIGYPFAITACFAGIVVGDMGLYWLGRLSGERAAKTRLFRRVVSEARLRQASHWLEKRGFAAVFISRFVAGLRLPTYLAAGFLKTNFLKFSIYFLFAAALWTPLLVIGAGYAQKLLFSGNFLLGLFLLFIVFRTLFIAVSRRRSRLFIGRIKKIYRWEFWPIQIFYAPVVVYALILGIRFRSLTVFTCANPAIPAGGFIGESKDAIYKGLRRSEAAGAFLLEHEVFDFPDNAESAVAKAAGFAEGAGYPVVLKPDSGERGKDVQIVKRKSELEESVRETEERYIIQEFAVGDEFSVFYYRYPSEPRGRIFSATEKIFPALVGDGISTIEEMILNDPRAVSIAATYIENMDDDPDRVPSKGETVRLIEIGTHARGAIFNDGARFITEELTNVIDAVCKGYEGFYFGRFDLRAASEEDLKQGRDFRIVELNGVTSESTNIYDRKFSLFDAYRILFRQWRIAFEIGIENRDLGAEPTGIRELAGLLFGARPEQVEATETA
jgi:membrane protein DedA with SNARE-associated domain